jgi:hypothetical protein
VALEPPWCTVALIDKQRRRGLIEYKEPLEAVPQQPGELTSESPARKRMCRFGFVGVSTVPSTLPRHMAQNSDARERARAPFHSRPPNHGSAYRETPTTRIRRLPRGRRRQFDGAVVPRVPGSA